MRSIYAIRSFLIEKINRDIRRVSSTPAVYKPVFMAALLGLVGVHFSQAAAAPSHHSVQKLQLIGLNTDEIDPAEDNLSDIADMLEAADDIDD
ncbi:MAG: hypothetical protein ACTIH0_07895, partial [Psychrobacter celer]